jgi:Tol biopolymer transport system component/tRNA A-37 threonylcarbamoyl transferase component Bud32
MALPAGTRLGPYEILSLVGAGGMGEVYKARDTRLDRTIAIKVLPPHTAERADVRQRFEREARTVSALNHPHICTLYDIGQEDGRDYLVMEYLDGETLAERLRRGALPLKETLRTAIEVGDAVDRAHRTGIVHRDLKPGNIMLTKDGAKVLDFGLAKMRAQSAGAAMSGGSVMQTLTSPLTGEGSIVGTLQYMAPEQLEGKEADARSDIFSFGVVLYEMATGRKPFDSRTQAGLIAQIMQTDPPGISAVLPQAPAALEQLARTCLAKDPDNRRQTMRDVLTDLHWIATPASHQEAVKPGTARRGLPIWIWVAAAVLFAATIAVIAVFRLHPTPTAPVTRFTIPAPPNAAFGLGVALSPDGRQLAFVAVPEGGQDLLWIRTLDSLTARSVRGSDGAQSPFWSPDGRSIGFFAQGKLKRVDLPDGPVQVICDAPDPRGGSWGPDGTILVGPDAGSPLQRVPAAGGNPTPITKLDVTRVEYSHRWPHFLPDGRHFLCYVFSNKAANSVIAVGSLDSPELRFLTQSSSAAFYSQGFVLFARGTTLVAQTFNVSNFSLAGSPFAVAEDVNVIGVSTGQSAAMQVSVSGTGSLVYQSGGTQKQQLAWFDRGGKPLGSLGPPGTTNTPEISPDGKRVSVDGAEDIWIYDTLRGNATRFTTSGNGDSSGTWSPDGSRIAYAAARNGKWDLYVKPVGGGGEQALVTSDFDKNPDDWSRDGRVLVYDAFAGRNKLDLWWLPVDGDRKPVPYLQTEFAECHARLSPDGKWLAYASDETGRPEIYVQSFPTPGNKVLISANGGDQPSWRRDGKELYYLALDRKLMAVAVKPGATFESGEPEVLFQTRAPALALLAFRNHYAPAADGLKFLVATIPRDESAMPLVMVQNWASGIGKF